MKILINYYTEEEFYVIYSIQIYTIFPCPDTNISLIHYFPPYINEKVLMKY